MLKGMEFLIIGFIVIILILFALINYFSVLIILQIGIILTVTGLLFGAPAGCYYHFVLFNRKKQTSGRLENWWITPYKYHKFFSEEDQQILNKWFFIGALFFNISMVGRVLVFLYFFSKNN